MIRIITIEREYGSGGAEIAKKSRSAWAGSSGTKVLTNEIARVMDCDCRVVEQHEEKRDPLYYRLLKASCAAATKAACAPRSMKMVDTDCVREVAQKVVPAPPRKATASSWAAAPPITSAKSPRHFPRLRLRSVPRKSPPPAGTGKSERKLPSWRRRWTATGRDFIKRYFRVDWPARHCFHLMVDSTMGCPTAVETILNGIAMIEKQQTGSAPGAAAPQPTAP